MKTAYLIFIFIFYILFSACRKNLSASETINTGDNTALNTEASNGPVRVPAIDYNASTKTQYIATGISNEYADVVLKFFAKKAGVSIVSFKFLAYETNDKDANTIEIADKANKQGFFSPILNYPNAKAESRISGLNIKLNDDGTSKPVTFRVRYNSPSPSQNIVYSGDTVSIKLIEVEYTDKQHTGTLSENVASSLSQEMMITRDRPFIDFDTTGVDPLQAGITKICTVHAFSVGVSPVEGISINNLPLVINATNTKITNNLIVKDGINHTINTNTIHDGNHYTIQFVNGYPLGDPDGYSFYIYDSIKEVNGSASLNIRFQNSTHFSWTDLGSVNQKTYTTQNAVYYFNYPTTVTTIHN